MIIALLTDFGTKDHFVGAVKGVILSINPGAKIIDITHEIQPQDIYSAGFILSNCFREFPEKTIFVAVVDPGVGSRRKSILVETDNFFFIAPDNGLLSFVLDTEPNFRVFEIINQKFFRQPVSQTFHGRDIFSPVAAWVSKGVEPSEFGREISEITRLEIPQPKILTTNEIEGVILYIDHFGNLITNFRRNDLAGDFQTIVNNQVISKHLTNYSEAEKNEIFSIFGSTGFLEIVANQNSAGKLLNISKGDSILIES